MVMVVMAASAWAVAAPAPAPVAKTGSAGSGSDVSAPADAVPLPPARSGSVPAAGTTDAGKTGEAAPAKGTAFDDLKSYYKDAPIVAQIEVSGVEATPQVSQRLVWEVKGALQEVIKGPLGAGPISIHVESVVRQFKMPRTELTGKEFVVLLKPLTESSDRRFQLVGPSAYPADSSESQILRQLAQADSGRGTGGTTLELTVTPLVKNFAPSGPKTLEIRLTNNGADTATYPQAPITEYDGKLYITGQGVLRIRDTAGRVVPDKGNILVGQPPPPPLTPAVILPRGSFKENVDLTKFYDLPEGRYTLMVALATPDSRSRISSNGFSFQVGGTPPVAEVAALPKIEPVKPPEVAEGDPLAAPLPEVIPTKRALAVSVPDPARYLPGKPYKGLTGLLKPTKSRYALGEEVFVELRLINDGPRTLAVDARLERTLTLTVQPVGDSPQPLTVRQVIAWPADGPTMPDERAYLRENAFWGRIINLNSLFGKGAEGMTAPSPDDINSTKGLPYEKFGKILFGFPKPGFYNITAMYTVNTSRVSEAPPGGQKHDEWWVGEITTNPITIQIMESGSR
jgi:hypothetical protein